MSEEAQEMGGMGVVMGVDWSKEARIRLMAGKFLGHPGCAFRKVYAGEGVLAATDGRILLHVEAPEIHRRDGDGDSENILTFGKEWEVGEKLGGTEWCRVLLHPVAHKLAEVAKREALERNRENQRSFDRGVDNAKRICPCCGEVVYAWGDDLLREEDVEKERQSTPTAYFAKRLSIVLADGARAEFNAAYLDLAIEVELELGGLEGAWLHKGDEKRSCPEVIFRGKGWFVLVVGYESSPYWETPDASLVAEGGASDEPAPEEAPEEERRTEPAQQNQGGEKGGGEA